MSGLWKDQKLVLIDNNKDYLARNKYEKQPFEVKWSNSFQCWCLKRSQHILVTVEEIWVPS